MNVQLKDLAARVGTVIPGLRGKVTKVFPPKEGDGAHGKWKFQNISLEEDGTNVQVTLSGLETMDESNIGEILEFQSKGTKFGLKGVSVEQREYDDKAGNHKKVIGVKITKTAIILRNGEDADVQEDAKDDLDMGPPMEKEVKKITLKSRSTDKSAADRIAQFGKLYDLCFIEAAKVPQVKDDDVKDVASCFFISAMREGWADKMEVKDEDANF